jgi:hypothetical protein
VNVQARKWAKDISQSFLFSPFFCLSPTKLLKLALNHHLYVGFYVCGDLGEATTYSGAVKIDGLSKAGVGDKVSVYGITAI